MKTAVEWYNEQLNMYGDMAFNKEISLGQYHIKKQELFEQALEMEKEQIVKHSVELTKILISHSFKTSGKTPKELVDNYFNKTFKQQEQ
jgi:hypothetical protein